MPERRVATKAKVGIERQKLGMETDDSALAKSSDVTSIATRVQGCTCRCWQARPLDPFSRQHWGACIQALACRINAEGWKPTDFQVGELRAVKDGTDGPYHRALQH